MKSTLLLLLGSALIYTAGFIAGIQGREKKHIYAPNPLLREYQLELDVDSAYLYNGDVLVGVVPHGKDGIDSLIMMDNQ